MLKADTHEGFWSRATLREQSSSVCTIDFIDVIHSWEQNVHPENNLVPRASFLEQLFWKNKGNNRWSKGTKRWERDYPEKCCTTLNRGKLNKLENAPTRVLLNGASSFAMKFAWIYPFSNWNISRNKLPSACLGFYWRRLFSDFHLALSGRGDGGTFDCI